VRRRRIAAGAGQARSRRAWRGHGARRYYLLGFGFDSPIPTAPRRIGEDELRTLFILERGWRDLAMRPAELVALPLRGTIPATVACSERI